jgi:hypothetical protein
VYVEVTRPDQSKAYRRAQSMLRAVTDLVEGIKLPFTLEIFLRRVPAADEVETIRANVARFCATRVAAGELPLEGLSGSEFLSLRQGESGHLVEFAREELPEDLGLLILTQGKPGEIVVTNRQGWLRPTEGDKQAMRMRRSSVCGGSGSGRKRRTSRRQVNNSRRRVRKPSSKIIIKVPLCAGRVHPRFAISGAIGSMLTGPEGRRRAIVRAASASVGNGSASFFSPQATVGNLRVSQTECPPG